MKYTLWINRPLNFFLTLLVIIFVLESIIMFSILLLLPNISEWAGSLIDAGSLTFLSAFIVLASYYSAYYSQASERQRTVEASIAGNESKRSRYAVIKHRHSNH